MTREGLAAADHEVAVPTMIALCLHVCRTTLVPVAAVLHLSGGDPPALGLLQSEPRRGQDDLVKLLHLGPELVLDALRKKRDSRDDLPSPGRSWPGHAPRRGAGFASFGCPGPTRGPSSHQQGVQIGEPEPA